MIYPLTDMAMGYFRSRTLAAAARLQVADAIGARSVGIDALAQQCQADRDSLYRLLRALASFGIVRETEPGSFTLTETGSRLRRDHPESEWPSVVFWGDLLSDSWAQLTECVRRGENAFQVTAREGVTLRWAKDPDARSIFGAVMGTGPAENYARMAAAWDFSRYTKVADLGGGGGALIEAILDTHPAVRGMLVDRPEFIEKARGRFARQARCELVSADLLESVPEGADVHVLKHVLHGYTDEIAAKLLRNCREALIPGGRVLVIEFVLPDVVDQASPELERRLMSDINMLAVTGGRERSAREWRALIAAAGLELQAILPVPEYGVSFLECS